MAGWPGEGKGPLPHRTSVSLFVEGNNHSTHPASLTHSFIHSFIFSLTQQAPTEHRQDQAGCSSVTATSRPLASPCRHGVGRDDGPQTRNSSFPIRELSSHFRAMAVLITVEAQRYFLGPLGKGCGEVSGSWDGEEAEANGG